MKTHLVILLVSLCSLSSGQALRENGISISFGGATFRMDDMKHLQRYILSTFPVEGKVISSFPPYASGGMNLAWQWYPSVRIGAGYMRTVTGATSDYTDYTGSVHNEIIAASHRIGAQITYTFAGTERLNLSLYGRADGSLSRVQVTTSIYVLGASSGGIDKYGSFSPNGSAGLELMYHLDNFSLGIDGGYLVDGTGDLSNTDSGNDLKDPADLGKTLTTDWTGWRAGLRAILWLNL